MNPTLLVIYFSLIVFIGLISVCESGKTKKFCCRKVKGSDKNNPLTVCPAPKRNRDDACDMQDTWVVITLNPILNDKKARKLQIVWSGPEYQEGDVIRLYKNGLSNSKKPVFEVIPHARFGMSQTQIYETFIDLALKFQPICMGYYVIYWRGQTVLASSCLQTNPTWMEDYEFGSMRLWDMFIPGTHDSSAYHTAYNPEKIERLDNYVFTQEDSILEQLLHGARALDLRVGKGKGVYYAHHGMAELYPFQEVLDDIITFLDATKEIVILDFHDFPVGINDNTDHLELVNHIYTYLGPYMAPPDLGWDATLNDIWATGKHLIVSYNHVATYEARKDILWPIITQEWGNVQTVSALYDYLSATFERPPEGMWAAQSELTATANDLLSNSLGGLREMAQRANTLVSKWFRGRWGRMCHIVAMDYIRTSSIVNIAIEWNLRKSYTKLCPIDKEETEEKNVSLEEEEGKKLKEEEERESKPEEEENQENLQGQQSTSEENENADL